MAPASPTAVLAVPDRPLAERPDTKGAEAPGGQFAGLMAQIKPAPRPESRRPLSEAPAKDEGSPTESAQAAAGVAQAQAAAAAQAREPKREAPSAEPDAGQAAGAAQTPGQAAGQAAVKASAQAPAEASDSTASARGAVPAGLPQPAQTSAPAPSPAEASATLAMAAAKDLAAKAAAEPAPTAVGPAQTTVIQSDTGLALGESDAAPLAAPGLVQAVLAEADAKTNPFKASPAEGRAARTPLEAAAALKAAPKEAGSVGAPSPHLQGQAAVDAARASSGSPHAAETPAQTPRAEETAVDLRPLLERASMPATAPGTLPAEGLSLGIEGAAPKLQAALTSPVAHQPEAGSPLVALATRPTPAAPAAPAATASPAAPAGPPPNAPMAQVEGSLRWMLKAGTQEAKLQLHPDSLGQVTIHLKVEGGEVHARLWVTEPASVQAVQEGRPHLEQSLREQGLQLGSFDLQQGHRPFQEAPGAPAYRESGSVATPVARQEAPAPAQPSVLTPHHVELYA